MRASSRRSRAAASMPGESPAYPTCRAPRSSEFRRGAKRNQVKCSSDRPVLPGSACGRKYYLPKLVRHTATEGPGESEEIVAPHPAEPFVAEDSAGSDLRLEISPPGHQRTVVIGAKIMPILQAEESRRAFGQMTGKGKLTIGKDVFADPQGSPSASVRPHGVQKKQTFRIERFTDNLKKTTVVAPTHMLEHSDRDDLGGGPYRRSRALR